jgi:hypothetical protein
MDTQTYLAIKKAARKPEDTAFGHALADALKKLEAVPHKPQAPQEAPAVPVRQANGFKMEA